MFIISEVLDYVPGNTINAVVALACSRSSNLHEFRAIHATIQCKRKIAKLYLAAKEFGCCTLTAIFHALFGFLFLDGKINMRWQTNQPNIAHAISLCYLLKGANRENEARIQQQNEADESDEAWEMCTSNEQEAARHQEDETESAKGSTQLTSSPFHAETDKTDKQGEAEEMRTGNEQKVARYREEETESATRRQRVVDCLDAACQRSLQLSSSPFYAATITSIRSKACLLQRACIETFCRLYYANMVGALTLHEFCSLAHQHNLFSPTFMCWLNIYMQRLFCTSDRCVIRTSDSVSNAVVGMTNNLDIATDQAHELIAFISTLLFFNKTRATIHVFPKEGADLLASTIYIVDRSLISEEKNSEYIHYALISIDIH